MAVELSRLQSPAAIQAALDEFSRLGRKAFLSRYGFGKSRDFLVRDGKSGQLCDSKAIVGAAFGYQFPEEGPLKPADFSGGEATVVPRLQRLGFDVVRIGEDWSSDEVQAAVASYFEMLRLEAAQQRYTKSEFNAQLRQKLSGRSKGSVELKFQNISAVLHGLELPFVQGYKPRSNAQLLLRQTVQQYVLDQPGLVSQVVDAMEEVKTPDQQAFHASVVDPPTLETVVQALKEGPKLRFPRKVNWAQRDEANRKLGRAGEQWVIGFEQRRLADAGYPELFQQLDWVSDRLGDGIGYDILSHERPGQHRFIEVKTTNGGHASSFIISRNELDFAAEAEDAFHLYRVFQFREKPRLYILKGQLADRLHLEPIDYRASFRRLVA
ncbi:DUF3883 domain-containing protein [Hydrogenophaga taeniospiralis]|uniref:DUF3883 domain-containing protein n=1 Tax=Hydrogenophaga taeniospiralis TaxID=65656 RepID=UPI001CFAEE4F|nr:DUF3883 domain-containing protein [Hydrogenophaga taeniospiralis]UCU96330.1 DUF3883 domain-containing protein [Hydrogenophaga taeniospiralis]